MGNTRATGQNRPDRYTAGILHRGPALPWSSGVVEGNVNRLKMLKRQMYGRAGFPLLRKRVILTG
jgi:transposase